MKKLLLLRHAKSSWDDPAFSDFERPLNARGLITAAFMGELIARRKLEVDAIISSPASRAAQTAMLVKENGGLNASLIFDERIYEASPQTLLVVVSGLGDDLDSAMLVGHNPGIESFIGLLTATVEPMPTAALALIKINIQSWGDIKFGTGTLIEVIRPKEMMTAEL